MRRNLLLVLVLLFCFLVTGCNADNVVATVNGDKITRQQYDDRYGILKASYEAETGASLDTKKDKETIKKLEDQAYDDLVVQKLLDQEASKQGVKVTDKEIDDNINYIKSIKNKTDPEGYEKFLKDLGLNTKQVEALVKEELVYRKMGEKATAGVVISDQEAKTYYEQNQKMFEEPAGIQIYHILVEKEETAREVLKKINAGEDWNKLASEYSMDESNKNSGGDLGPVSESSPFVEEFKTAALKLKPGEITQEPVKSQFGCHIIKAGENVPASITPFDKMKDLIKSQLENENKAKTFRQYIDNLKKKADIKDMRTEK